MNNLLKILLLTSPIIGILLRYVVAQQSQLDNQLRLQDSAFEREWQEEQAELATTREAKQIHEERAREAEKKILAWEEAEKKAEKKARKFEKEFDEAIKNFEHKERK